MPRNPCISLHRIPHGEKRQRRATLHFPECRPDFASAASAELVACRYGTNERATLEISGVDGQVDLVCSELMALRSLAEIDVEIEDEVMDPEGHFSNDELIQCPKCEGRRFKHLSLGQPCDLCDQVGKVRCDVADVWHVRQGIERGNPWAWCSARVHVTIGKVRAYSSWLGACSYKDLGDYERGGYYDDQVRACLMAIAEHMGIPQSGARPLWEDLDERVQLEAVE